MTEEAFDLTMQARWEVEASRLAERCHHEAAAAAGPASLPSGQRMLRKIILPLAAKIEAAQFEAMANIACAGGSIGFPPGGPRRVCP